MAEFETRVKDNRYRLWNRMSSGSSFPPPVRTVTIPKADGGERKLGIPTVSDRIAQMVVKSSLEPVVDPLFHPDSYGYRPRKSALEAVGQTRQRCWKLDWVIDLDIQGFFDNIEHDLLRRAGKKHAQEKWVVLYIERWLQAPAQAEDGHGTARGKGTPQGGVVSPRLANLFLHYAFDRGMQKTYPHLLCERYADDAIVHCRTEADAQEVRRAIAGRMQACRLALHPDKTKIVSCKDDERRGTYPHAQFDFLGYPFRPRRSKNWKGKFCINFSPAVAEKAGKAMRAEIRSGRLHLRSDKSIEELARRFTPKVRGGLPYYGRYYRSALYPIMRQLDRSLARWSYRQYKKRRGHLRRATHGLARISRRDPGLFAPWQRGVRRGSTAGAV
jgi:RNA-directed DNA polymerase